MGKQGGLMSSTRGLIETRLRASVALGAVDGTDHERGVFEAQALEAANELEQLRVALRAIADMRVDETTDHAQLAALCIAMAQTAVGA